MMVLNCGTRPHWVNMCCIDIIPNFIMFVHITSAFHTAMLLTHCSLGDLVIIKKVLSLSEHMLTIKVMSTSCEIALRWVVQNTFDDVGSGNGLVPSGNKPLPEPVLSQIYVTIWYHNGLIHEYHLWALGLLNHCHPLLLLIWITWTSLPSVWERPLNHSLTPFLHRCVTSEPQRNPSAETTFLNKPPSSRETIPKVVVIGHVTLMVILGLLSWCPIGK